MIKKLLLPLLLLLTQAMHASAADFSLSSVPDPLKSWIPWVLDDVPTAVCPQTNSDNGNRRCAWPGLLELKAQTRGGSFTQDWTVQADSWVVLPGDADHWPQDVMLDGKPVAVIGREQLPVVKLSRGLHKVSGQLVWNTMPESLALPSDTGLLKLELQGQPVALPVRDTDNRLWLQRKVDTESADQVQIRVFRKVKDGVPVSVETFIHLDVSGKSREIIVGRALLPELIPQDMQSALPATIKPDGSLTVQARAGSWDVRLTARHPGAVKSLVLTKGSGLVADEEVWVFEAAPYIRTAAIEGPSSVDPQQTMLPGEWRNLPAYLMHDDSHFNFKEIRRGDSDPTPDKLSLHRRLWLSFDGSALTVSDVIQGDISRASRLAMDASAQLGRVGIAGQDRLITRGNDKLAGVEVGRGNITLNADSFIQLQSHKLSAVSWRLDFDKVGMELNLPAGWRLLHAGGVDRADGAWLARWNLLDFFVVLVTALAASQLWGRKWGVLALLSLILLYQETDAPRYLWISLFALTAIARALPVGAVQLWISRFERFALLLLVVTSLVFATSQVRSALYPVLESDVSGNFTPDDMSAMRRDAAPVAPAAPAPAPPEGGAQEEARVAEPVAAPPAMQTVPAQMMPPPEAQVTAKLPNETRKSSYILRKEISESKLGTRATSFTTIDPDAKVQTGLGLPTWQWRRHILVFDGPVRQDQQLDLWLLSPWAVKCLVVIRLIFLAVLLACVAGVFRRAGDDEKPGNQGAAGKKMRWPWTTPAKSLVSVLLLTMMAGGIFDGEIAQAQTPDNAQLEELKNKLTRPADCLPTCGEISRLLVQISGNAVRLGLDVDAAVDTSLALPGDAKSWIPAEVRIDGKPAYVHRGGNGELWLLTPAGKHRVELIGNLKTADTLQLPLPHKPRHVDIKADGWDVSGISEETGVADALQLSRQIKAGDKTDAPALPGFLNVERRLVLDKEWQVFTTVSRRSPTGISVLAQIPLLPGEAVTSSGMNIKGGKLEVNLGPHVDSVEWRSTLPQTAQLTLQTTQQSDWVESWIVSASSIWHLSTSGIPPAASDASVADTAADLQFYPWPGEVLKLVIDKPQAIAGQTMTIDASRLIVSPGARASDYVLHLNLRSSRGGDYSITLPPDAVLQKVSINQQVRPIRANGRQLVLPIVPGAQQIEVSWRIDQGMGSSYSTSSVNLHTDSVNNWLELKLPHDRWLLLASGPGLGPAILFWGKLIVLLIVAALLGRFGGLTLPISQWLLLALGLTQVDWWSTLLVVAWFYVCKLRSKAAHHERPVWQFNLYQIGMVMLTLAMLVVMVAAVTTGLLGQPDMQVTGNGSYSVLLRWYLDRAGAELHTAWIFSLPVSVYRGLMLLWALWLAWSLLAWLKSGWQAFASGSLWKSSKHQSAGKKAEPEVHE